MPTLEPGQALWDRDEIGSSVVLVTTKQRDWIVGSVVLALSLSLSLSRSRTAPWGAGFLGNESDERLLPDGGLGSSLPESLSPGVGLSVRWRPKSLSPMACDGAWARFFSNRNNEGYIPMEEEEV